MTIEQRVAILETKIEQLEKQNCQQYVEVLEDFKALRKDLTVDFKDLRAGISQELSTYQLQVWQLVDKMWKGILTLVGIIALFAGVKLAGPSILEFFGIGGM